jgi:hypothetical protein
MKAVDCVPCHSNEKASAPDAGGEGAGVDWGAALAPSVTVDRETSPFERAGYR